jgi:hypothetical protein
VEAGGKRKKMTKQNINSFPNPYIHLRWVLKCLLLLHLKLFEYGIEDKKRAGGSLVVYRA